MASGALTDAVAALRRGDRQTAEARCREALAEQEGQPEALHLAGVLAHQAGRHNEARKQIERAIAIQPANAEFYNSLGAACLAGGTLDEAESAFQRALELRPTYAEAHHNLGLCLERRSLAAEAEIAFGLAAEHNPGYASAHRHLGKLLEQRGDLVGAVECFRRAVDAAPRSSLGHHALGNGLRLAGQLMEAEAALRQGIANCPPSAELHNLLGVIYSQEGRQRDAVECYRQALAIAPGFAAQANLGMALVELGEPAEALPALEQVCEQRPTTATYWIALMRCRLALGLFAEAVEAGRRAMSADPQSLDAQRYLALSLERAEDWEAAQTAYAAVDARQPNDPEVLFALGRLAARREEWREAVDYCRRALAAKSDYPQANLFLGQLLGRITQRGTETRLPLPQVRDIREEAVLHLKRAVSLAPTAEAYAALGQALHEVREHEQARICFEEALQRNPRLVEALNSLGNVLLELGEIEAGENCFVRALEIEPRSARAHFNLAKSRKSAAPAAEIENLRSLLATGALSLPQQLLLQFAIGALADGAHRYDEAFEAYRAGNSLKQLPAFVREHGRPRHDDQFVEQLVEVFDRGFFRERAGWGAPTARPIFVVGMPRSGTTLTEQILSSHPDVHGAGELGDIAYYAHKLAREGGRQSGYPRGLAAAARDRVAQAAAAHDRRLAQLGSRAPYVVDKMPGNFMHLGLIALLFPHAKIVHCQRDPLDVCVSCFRNNLDWPFCDLEELGRFHRRYERIMAHWREVLPLPILEQSYEAMVSDFEPHARALVAHCGLEWDDRCLEFHKTERAVGTPSKWQVRQPIYDSSVGLWQRYERHLEPLKRALAGES